MTLFGFFKKGHGDSPAAPEGSDRSGERISAFKGDLAYRHDADIVPKKESDKAGDASQNRIGENKDSAHSVVYMSFAPTVRNIWICEECGTHNKKGLTGCIVCGLEK